MPPQAAEGNLVVAEREWIEVVGGSRAHPAFEKIPDLGVPRRGPGEFVLNSFWALADEEEDCQTSENLFEEQNTMVENSGDAVARGNLSNEHLSSAMKETIQKPVDWGPELLRQRTLDRLAQFKDGGSTSRVELPEPSKASSRWAQLTIRLGLSAYFGSLPTNVAGDGPDESIAAIPCNGHVSEAARLSCPCRSLDPPKWLRGTPRHPHDSSNCRFAGDIVTSCCEDESCEEELSAEDDPPREWMLKWWRWPRQFRSRMRHGIKLPWTATPPRYCREPDPNYDSAHHEKVYEEFCRLRRRQFIEGPFARDDPRITSVQPIGAVPKKDAPGKPRNRKRVVVDSSASGLNDLLPKWLVNLPNVRDALARVRGTNWYGAKIDLSDAFFMSPLSPYDRQFHAVVDPTPAGWRPPPDSDEHGKEGVRDHVPGHDAYRYRVTPFGNTLSPYYFISAVETMTTYLTECWGMDVLAYVDDFLCLGGTKSRVRATLAAVRASLTYLGFGESLEKFEDVDHVATWLGLDINMLDGIMEVQYPLAKRDALAITLQEFFDEHHGSTTPVDRLELAQLIGKINFASNGVRYGNLYIRALYAALYKDIEHLTLKQRVHCRGKVTLTDEFWADFRWWQNILPDAQGVRFHIDRQDDFHRIFGDASSAGRGANYYALEGIESISMPWCPSMQVASSNLRELHTVWDCIQEWGHRWERGARVLYSTDNMTTAKSVNRGWASSEQLNTITRKIHLWAAAHDVEIISRWVPGTSIIRESSDELSRAEQFAPPDPTVWAISGRARAHWRRVHGDVPELPHYMNVDFRLRDALRRREADPSYSATILVPDWPTAAWYRLLRKFRLDHRYDVNTPLLVHPTKGTCRTRHPIIVLRLPAPDDAPLTRRQRQHARSCV